MPQEVHEYRDRHGQPCRQAVAWFTIVTREPEWDAESRARAMRLREYEESLCPKHGIPRGKCRDPEVFWMVEEDVDWAERAEKRHERQQEDQRGKNDPAWNDGRRFWARPHDPHRDKPIPQATLDALERRKRGGQVGHGPPEG